MVTVRELFSSELPTLPGLANSFSTAEDALLQIAASSHAAAAEVGTGGISLVPVGPPSGPYFGPSVEFGEKTPEELEAQWASVRHARKRASEHLRLALQRRADSRSSACSETARCLGFDSCMATPSQESMRVPAVFPFPEPIPYGPPVARHSVQEEEHLKTAAAVVAAQNGASKRNNTTSASRPVSPTASTSPSRIPAVFPFPEPIPHEVPRRRPRREVQADSSPSPTPASRPEESPGSSRKYRSVDPEYIAENKQRANGWISECMPKAWILEYEKPVWLQLKHEGERLRHIRNKTRRQMPTMPFDLWLQVKQGKPLALDGKGGRTNRSARIAKKIGDRRGSSEGRRSTSKSPGPEGRRHPSVVAQHRRGS